MTYPRFDCYVGIDYSGAQTPTTRLPGLRVYMATARGAVAEVRPDAERRRHWTRRAIAEWLEQRLATDARTLVGVDHGFSFPAAYFTRHGLGDDWPAFLDDVHAHWPTDEDDVSVEDVRQGRVGGASERSGNARWRRVTEVRSGGAKSVFHFDVPGSVAKSTFAGLPWLRRIRRALPGRVHAWPFDGWSIPDGRSVIAEAYPTLWRDRYPRRDRTDDQHDAYVVAAGLRDADQRGILEGWLAPELDQEAAAVVAKEGWILGVEGSAS